MKLRDLLEVVVAPKMDITVENAGGFHHYVIDYTSDEPTHELGRYTYGCTARCIPEEVLDREVTYINATKAGVLTLFVYNSETIEQIMEQMAEG